MLFNSYGFIFIYLPIVFAGMFLIGARKPAWAAYWLGAASLAFYAAWDARYLVLLLGSILGNYTAGYVIGAQRAAGRMGAANTALWLAVAGNLALLGYFKYTAFLVAVVNEAAGTHLAIPEIVLPLGISFFTFTQIAFLVDVQRGEVADYSLPHYLLFVTYFPHLIAGPVLHHKQMMPQFSDAKTYRVNWTHLAVGSSIFLLGLAKKVLLADQFAPVAAPLFSAAQAGRHPLFADAWTGALAYTLQIYFDFSGYCDMAIGASLLFNVRLPLNFNSPYKATSMIDFWRRWHMTLSAFLRDYLYIPLGGNRKGPARRYANLLVTMLIGGLWHGAGWTFVAWGGLHGLYLMINHGWRGLVQRRGRSGGGWPGRLAGGALTFGAVVVAWVFFRADRFGAAGAILAGMAGRNGFAPGAGRDAHLELPPAAYLMLALGCLILWAFPNLPQIFAAYRPAWDQMAGKARADFLPESRLQWQPSAGWAVALAVPFFLCLLYMAAGAPSEFLYFQF